MPNLFSKFINSLKSPKNPPISANLGESDLVYGPGVNLDLVTTPILNRPSDRSGENSRICLAAGVTVLKHLQAISEATGILGPLKAACIVTTTVLETIKAMDSNKEAWRTTLHTIRRHHNIFEQQLRNMGAQNIPSDAEPGLLDPIKAYARDFESILAALMLENEVSIQSTSPGSKYQTLATFMKRYATVKVEAERISAYASQLDDSMKQFTASMTVYMGFKLHSVDKRLHEINSKLSVTNLVLPTTATEIKLKPCPRLVPKFIGREDILGSMRYAHFINPQTQQQTPIITVLSGLGGLGKTQTALKFALEFEERFPGIPVYFLDASEVEKLKIDLETIIRSQGPAYHSLTHEDSLNWLATELKNWLAIFDNADNPNFDLAKFIPNCTHGHVIITTRNATYASLAPSSNHALETLSISDSISLILNTGNYLDTEENRGTAEKIVLELGCLPLALAHAASYILVHRCLSTYLDMYRTNRQRIWASTDLGLLHDYHSSVEMTIRMSLEQLPQAALDILRLFSYLQATSIPYSVIVRAARRRFKHVEKVGESSLKPRTLDQADALMKVFCPGGEWSEYEFNDIIRHCLQYSLLQLTTQGDDNFYSIHVLVQLYLKAEPCLIQSHLPDQLVVRLLGSSITRSDNYEYLAFNRLLIPHIRLIDLESINEEGDHANFGHVLREVGDWQRSLAHREKAAEMCTKQYGQRHPDTIRALSALASSYSRVGRSQHGLELQKRVLDMHYQSYGPEHPETVKSIENLAIYYTDVGKHEAALQLREKALGVLKRIYRSEHPDTVRTMGNLAVSYKKLGRKKDAMDLEEDVLKIRKQQLGLEHPDTLMAKANLAVSYRTMGRNKEALEMEQQVLETRAMLLGQEHPDTLMAMWNLSITYQALHMPKELLDLLKVAVPAFEASDSYGRDHAMTVKLRNGLNKVTAYFAKGSNTPLTPNTPP